MKKITQLLLLTVTILLGSFSAKATHIVGGEIYYDSLGNNQYKVTFEIYRDCSGSDFDLPLNYTVFYANGTIWSQFQIDALDRTILPIVYDDPCVTPPDDICIERAIYVDTITLPFDIDGYYISYQRCCWANNIENIVDPGNNGITLTVFIPGASLVQVRNQAARFVNYPPLALCSNNTLTFDHSAFDPDGDSLVYSVVAPFLGGSSFDVMPNPESAAPYTPVNWEPGFSATQPFGTGSTITIDPETGSMDFTPNLIGTYVAGVQVDEWRDGLLINSKIRTFGYRVVGCNMTVPVTITAIGIGGPEPLADSVSLIEDCGFKDIIITRVDTSTTLPIAINLTGTATNGLDYLDLPDTLYIEQGIFSDTVHIEGLLDGLDEGDEFVTINLIIKNLCGEGYDTTSMTITIQDYLYMTLVTTDSLNVCSENGDIAMITAQVTQGYPPYVYVWTPSYPNSDTIYISPNDLAPNMNPFTLIVGDLCGKAIASDLIRIYNQCPMTVPNVMTVNGDGVNDNFEIANLDDFDKVSLKIFNRWGNIVYETDAYKNDWKGDDLPDGVYFYLVTPTSEKFVYDDQDKTQYTLHGFFHIYRK